MSPRLAAGTVESVTNDFEASRKTTTELLLLRGETDDNNVLVDHVSFGSEEYLRKHYPPITENSDQQILDKYLNDAQVLITEHGVLKKHYNATYRLLVAISLQRIPSGKDCIPRYLAKTKAIRAVLNKMDNRLTAVFKVADHILQQRKAALKRFKKTGNDEE